MVTIGSTKKTLLFNITTEGIKENDLEYWMRVIVEDISYGLKGEIQTNGKVKVSIPSVNDLPVSIDTSKECTLVLEAVGEQKYYIKAWEDKGIIKIEPKAVAEVASNVTEETIEDPIISATVENIIEEESEPVEEIEVKVENQKLANSLFNQVLGKG